MQKFNLWVLGRFEPVIYGFEVSQLSTAVLRHIYLIKVKHSVLHRNNGCEWLPLLNMLELFTCSSTRIGGKIFGIHPKIWCSHFKPQYLQNDSSPTNDLYIVPKRSIRAFKSIFKLRTVIEKRDQKFFKKTARKISVFPVFFCSHFIPLGTRLGQSDHSMFGNWLRTLRQNFARVVSLHAFQHVSKHAMVTLTQSCPQWYKVATEENRKNGNFARSFF